MSVILHDETESRRRSTVPWSLHSGAGPVTRQRIQYSLAVWYMELLQDQVICKIYDSVLVSLRAQASCGGRTIGDSER